MRIQSRDRDFRCLPEKLGQLGRGKTYQIDQRGFRDQLDRLGAAKHGSKAIPPELLRKKAHREFFGVRKVREKFGMPGKIVARRAPDAFLLIGAVAIASIFFSRHRLYGRFDIFAPKLGR